MATNLPPLSTRYTTPISTATSSGSGVDIDKAENIRQSIANFYDTTYASDVKATQQDKINGYDNVQNDDKVAADIATLHDLDMQMAQASGDTATYNRLSSHPDQLLDTTTNQLLAAASVDHKDSDFTYTATSISNSQGTGAQVKAQLKADSSNNQGVAAFTISGASSATQVNIFDSSLGTSGGDWGQASNSSNSQGGWYDAGDGQRIAQNLDSGNDTRGFTARQYADAYTYLYGLSDSARQAALSQSKDLTAIWNKGQSVGLSVSSPTHSTDAFNQLVQLFATN